MSDTPDHAAQDPLAERLALDVVFVLVHPQQPANVGAVARAMRNMGLERLIIVDPAPSFDPQRARWMAKGAGDLIDAIRIVPTLDDALVGVHRVVATTARHRRDGQTVHEPASLATQLLDDEPGQVTAVLFGREDDGLSRADVLRCESILRIPTAEHASLNLGQAALLVAHALFGEARARGMRPTGRMVGGRRAVKATRDLQAARTDDSPADVAELEPATEELLSLLSRVGYTRASGPERVSVMLRESLQRARLSRRQVRAIRGMVGRVEFALANPGIDWAKKSGD